jgi:PAS domain S-box-containing protein
LDCLSSQVLIANIAQAADWTESGTIDLANIIRLETPARQARGIKKLLVKSWPVAAFITDSKGQYVFVNAQWSNLSGVALFAALGSGWVTSIHEEDCEEVVRLWREAVKGEQPFGCSYRLNGKASDERWVLGQAMPHYDEDGELMGYSGTLVRTSLFSQIESGNQGNG